MDAVAQTTTQNPQDVGGHINDAYASTASAADAAEAPLDAAIEKSLKPVKFWEYQTHALQSLLSERGLTSSAALRRGIEQMPAASFRSKTYYEKWAAAMTAIGIERGSITQRELDAALGQDTGTPQVLYQEGDYVRVKQEAGARFRQPHLRTPGYVFGVVGRIAAPALGYLEPSDENSRHYTEGTKEPIYRVTFHQRDLWEGYAGGGEDTLQLEIYQSWLAPATSAELQQQQASRATLVTDHGHAAGAHSHGHDHDHGDHVHEERAQVEQKAVDDEGDDAKRSRLTQALVKVYTDRGTVTAAELAARIERLETWGNAGVGPAIVARAWTDPAFLERLREDGISAAAEVGAPTDGYPPRGGAAGPTSELTGTILKVLEDTPDTYHVIVCTLCSCYPVPVLGLAPSWYKARSYRARVVRNPHSVLAEFGTTVPEGVRIAVIDSNADTRFIKVPLRPAGTEGWSEERLRQLVTRDSMIGVRHPKNPEELALEQGDGSAKRQRTATPLDQ